MVNMAEVKKLATEEFNKEKLESAKRKYKDKLKQLHDAEKVVKNIKLELEDLEDELSQD